MDAILMLGILSLVLVIPLIFFIIRKAVKIALLIFVLVLALGLIFGVNVFKEFEDLRENKARNTIVLVDENKFLAGFHGKLTSSDTAISFMDETAGYDISDLELVKGSSFKLVLVSSKAFPPQVNININGNNFTSGEVLYMINSPNTLDALSSGIISMQQLNDEPRLKDYIRQQLKSQYNISTDAQARGFLFALLLSNSSDLSFWIESYKQGLVTIYPETTLFTLVRLLPASIIKRVSG